MTEANASFCWWSSKHYTKTDLLPSKKMELYQQRLMPSINMFVFIHFKRVILSYRLITDDRRKERKTRKNWDGLL